MRYTHEDRLGDNTMESIETQPNRGTGKSEAVPQAEADLATLRAEVERLRLKAEISSMQHGFRPWWRQGKSVTAAIGLIAAIIPVTTAVKGFFDERATREAASRTRVQEARDKYLDTVLKEPKNAQLILRYIIATSDDSKIREWANTESGYLRSPVIEKAKLYREATQIVGSLATADDEGKRNRFWQLYNVELLSVESPEFETLMVSAGEILRTCKDSPVSCMRSELKDLGFRMSHQMQKEMRVDAIAQPNPTTQSPAASPD